MTMQLFLRIDLFITGIFILIIFLMEEKNKFDPIPKQFLQDKFLVPNNFDDPENPDHGIYLHN